MFKYCLACLLLGAMAWGQATSPSPAPAAQPPAAMSPAQPTLPPPTTQVPLDAAVITITGMCDHPPADKTAAATCKTVITRAEFEKVVSAVQPSMPGRARRSFADRYAHAMVMAHKAEEMGLDKSPTYEERMQLARIQVLSQELGKALQEKASQIPDKDIEEYYHANPAKFEQADLMRVYIPKAEESLSFDEKDDKKDAKDAADEEKEKAKTEQAMKEAADKLRARAVAGEDFTKLQTEAFDVAGIKTTVPSVEMGKTRRNMLPPAQVSVLDMKPGEISPVIVDQNGYFIYKLKSKDVMPLAQARDEIKGTLRSQRLQEENAAVQQSATTTMDDAYFGPEPPARSPMPGNPMQQPQPKPTPPGPK